MKLLVLVIAVILAAIALSTAHGQTVTMPLDSVWAVWNTTAKHSVSAQPLRRNATTGALEAIPGQRVSLGALVFRNTEIRADFPGQTTSPMTIAGVRLFHKASGEDWDMPEHPINVTLRTPLLVPAGKSAGCIYLSPILLKGSLTCEVGLAVGSAVVTQQVAVKIMRNSTRAVVLEMADGMVFNRSIYPAISNLGVLADPIGAVSKIDFVLDGVLINVEGGAPYMACGDWLACPQIFALGSRVLTVIPYDTLGNARPAATIRYTVK